MSEAVLEPGAALPAVTVPVLVGPRHPKVLDLDSRHRVCLAHRAFALPGFGHHTLLLLSQSPLAMPAIRPFALLGGGGTVSDCDAGEQ